MNKVILTQRQYGHLVGAVERRGWGAIVGRLPIIYINTKEEPTPPTAYLGLFERSLNTHYVLEFEGRLTTSDMVELMTRIENT
jgi:hypothetical protein